MLWRAGGRAIGNGQVGWQELLLLSRPASRVAPAIEGRARLELLPAAPRGVMLTTLLRVDQSPDTTRFVQATGKAGIAVATRSGSLIIWPFRAMWPFPRRPLVRSRVGGIPGDRSRMADPPSCGCVAQLERAPSGHINGANQRPEEMPFKSATPTTSTSLRPLSGAFFLKPASFRSRFHFTTRYDQII